MHKIFILVLSLIFVIIFDYIEHDLRKNNPTSAYSLFKSFSFNSPDNEYYLSYTDNYLKGRGWRFSMYSMQKSDEPVGKGSYFRRVPGYPIVYFLFVSVFGEELGIRFLILFQHVLFFLSVFCFYKVLDFLQFSNLTKNLITLLYAIVPYFYSYCFFTITESISPYLFVFYIYFLLKAHQNVNKKMLNYILASFFLGYGILTRPYIGIGGVLIVYFLYKDFPIMVNFRHIRQHLIVLSVAGFMVLIWASRNYIVSGEFVLLEKAYHPESIDRMKPEFSSMRGFIRCWEPDPSKMNDFQMKMFYAAINDADTSSKYRENFIEKVPNHVLKIISKEEIDKVLIEYQKLLLSQKKYYDKNIPMPSEYTAEQLKVARMFDEFTNRFKAKYPIEYYLYRPLKQLNLIVIHSNTANIYMFQELRNYMGINIIRYGLALLHISLYIIMFLNLWWIKTHFKEVLLFSIVPILLVMFFVFIFQIVEQRYMLPFLSLLFLGLGFFLKKTMGAIFN